MGSHPLCSIRVTGSHIAPVHAVVQRGQDGTALRRLSRVHPVTVLDESIDARTLSHGDLIAVGHVEMAYVECGETAPSTLRLRLMREDLDEAVEVEIPQTRAVLGRSEGDIRIDDGSVSARHVAIENFGEGLRWAVDLQSTNGSELNGRPLVGRQRLRTGDILTLGRVEIELLDGGSPWEGGTPVSPRHVQFIPPAVT